jgi:hypothetical protein
MKHKQSLTKQYLSAIHRLADLLVHKTTFVEKNNEDLNSILEHFRMIDARCQSSLDTLDQNRALTSSALVANFIEKLDGLEIDNRGSAIAAIFTALPIQV